MAPAWLLTVNDGRHAAVGERELVHIVSDEVERVVGPTTSDRINECIIWQNRRLPLFDASANLRNNSFTNDLKALPAKPGKAIYVVAAYQLPEESQISFGAIAVLVLPERIEVSDETGCNLPPESTGWKELAHSCFKHQQFGAVPILDLVRVFGEGTNPGPYSERTADA
jgi:hypothetical protein